MTVYFVKENRRVSAVGGETLLDAAKRAGIRVEAPCGGNGTCGKCRARVSGTEVLMCCTPVSGDMEVFTLFEDGDRILSEGKKADVIPDGTDRAAVAFDIGTTTVVCYLMDGVTGEVLSSASMLNPQISYGADVISRIQAVLLRKDDALSLCIRKALSELLTEACGKVSFPVRDVTMGCIVGNTAMHHLLLGIDPRSMTVPPYMPKVFEAIETDAASILPELSRAQFRILPNIAGFVGADTVSCMLSTGMDADEELSLLIDIGTNGEMVLGKKDRRITCSTAAGPAFEGARISCGMRGATGAIHHVERNGGSLSFDVIGGGEPKGICGSGLMDLIACLLSEGLIDENGHMQGTEYRIPGTDLSLSQRDVREVQVAKAAIAAGIELLIREYGARPEEIRKVKLAGAFGTFLRPESVCRIGLIPKEFLERIEAVGNAAGEGARMCALSREAFLRSQRIARETEFLELACLADFQDIFIDCLEF